MAVIRDKDSHFVLLNVDKYNSHLIKLRDKKMEQSSSVYKSFHFLCRKAGTGLSQSPNTGYVVWKSIHSGACTTDAAVISLDVSVGNMCLYRRMELFHDAEDTKEFKLWDVSRAQRTKLY